MMKLAEHANCAHEARKTQTRLGQARPCSAMPCAARPAPEAKKLSTDWDENPTANLCWAIGLSSQVT